MKTKEEIELEAKIQADIALMDDSYVYDFTSYYHGFIEGAEYANQSKWISVDDRLPELKQEILITLQYQSDCVHAFLREVDREGKPKIWCALMSDYAQIIGNAYYDGDIKEDKWTHVTHWQPLPEPPK